MPIHLEIVTPEKVIYAAEVDSATVPGVEGELGLLPMHAALVTTLAPGELSYTKGSAVEHLAVGEGILEVSEKGIRILTDLAVTDAEIDEAEVEAALARAKEALEQRDEDTNPEEIAAVMASIQKSMAQLKIKRRRTSI